MSRTGTPQRQPVRAGGGVTGNGCEVSFWGDKKFLKLDHGGDAELPKCTNPLHMGMGCTLHLSKAVLNAEITFRARGGWAHCQTHWGCLSTDLPEQHHWSGPG